MKTVRVSCLDCDCLSLVELDKIWDVKYCPSCGAPVEEEDIIHEDVDFDEWDDDDDMDIQG